MDWDTVSSELSKKLDPAHVKKPKGSFGPKGDYIEGWHAIAEANRIFGFDGWSYSIRTMSQDGLDQVKNSRDELQWQAAYTCIVTVKVGDVSREDIGFGSGFAKNKGDAIEGATKEAVTDALKRALRTFGNPFGLALYDKEQANVGVDFDPVKFRDEMKPHLARARSLEDLKRAWIAVHNRKDELPAPMFAELEAEKDKRKDHLTGPDPAMQAPSFDGPENSGAQYQ